MVPKQINNDSTSINLRKGIYLTIPAGTWALLRLQELANAAEAVRAGLGFSLANSLQVDKSGSSHGACLPCHFRGELLELSFQQPDRP